MPFVELNVLAHAIHASWDLLFDETPILNNPCRRDTFWADFLMSGE